MEELLTLKELSEYLKIAEKTLYGYAQKGTIPGIKIGSAWRFRESDIKQWLEERRQATQKTTGGDRKKEKGENEPGEETDS